MRKIMFISILVLVMLSSLVAGTLANYTVSVDLAKGNTIAKEFIFVKEGIDTFFDAIKIAPAETVEMEFSVQNYQNSVVTETDLYYKLTFNAVVPEGKQAIEPLIITVKDSDGNDLGAIAGTGSLEVSGEFLQSETGQFQHYIVEVYWPEGSNDIDYVGGDYGTAIRVDAVASQVPLEITEPEEPEQGDPEDSELSGIEVLYETQYQGQEAFRYTITITNNSEQDINNWNIMFLLPTDRITTSERGVRADHGGLPEGTYKFIHPENYMFDIPVGESVYFGGTGDGRGTGPIEDVKVNDKPVELRCVLLGNETPEEPGQGNPEEPGDPDDPQGPTDPDDPELDGIEVHYETKHQQWGQEIFRYTITITNNSEQVINNWNLTFSLPTDRITSVEGGVRENHEGLPEGTYKFVHPQNYNINIPAGGGSISFGGTGDGWGTEPIEDVKVNDNPVELTYELRHEDVPN